MTVETKPKSSSKRIVDPDGATVEVFPLPTDEANLLELMRDLFANHWDDITFGPMVQGAAWEMRAAQAPSKLGVPHFHICIGEHKGPHNNPVSPELAHHRRTARAELYRRLKRDGTPVSWGVRLFNGKDEQQITVLLPNPYLDRETDKILRKPDWSRLYLWDQLRARWLGQAEPDPLDRSGTGFRHS